MRILLTIADGNPGGGTTHMLQILKGLRQTHDLSLVTQRESYLLNEALSLGIPAMGINFFSSRLDLRIPLLLSRATREFTPDVVHVHGGRAAFFHSVVFDRIPLVYTVHGYHFLHKNPLMRRFALEAERLASRRSQVVVFGSRHDARVARDHRTVSGEVNETIIYNGVPARKFHGRLPREPGHIGFIGRLEHPKDPLLFLEVLERLPGYRATIVGGGSLEDEVRAEVRRRGMNEVSILGALPHGDSLKVLSVMGVLVMTSRWEGMPYLPLEAMQVGVPVVATRVGALDEIIEDGRSGLLVEGRSPDDIARAVRRVAEDAKLRERIVEEGRDRVRSLFSEEQMLAAIGEVYRRVGA